MEQLEMSINEDDLIKATDNLYQVDEANFKMLFSEPRVKSFGGQEEYRNYFHSSKSLYPAIHTLEVVLRNKIDSVLSQFDSNDPYWIMALYFYNARVLKDKNQQMAILKAQKNIESVIKNLPHPKKYPTISVFWDKCQNKQEFHNILISRLNLGFWITILQNNKFFNDTYNTNIDFAQRIFPKLESRIQTKRSEFFRFIGKQKQTPKKVQGATPSEKTILLVSFLSGIRNRLNHCEILFKPSGGSLNITTKLYDIEIYFDCRKNRILELLVTILEDFL